MSTMVNLTPGSEVEWDLLPPAQGVQRGMVSAIIDGSIEVVFLRLSKARVVVTGHVWLEPYEVDRLRRVGGQGQ